MKIKNLIKMHLAVTTHLVTGGHGLVQVFILVYLFEGVKQFQEVGFRCKSGLLASRKHFEILGDSLRNLRQL
jgi:hypothetical protein